jgi:hypothetical protein
LDFVNALLRFSRANRKDGYFDPNFDGTGKYSPILAEITTVSRFAVRQRQQRRYALWLGLEEVRQSRGLRLDCPSSMKLVPEPQPHGWGFLFCAAENPRSSKLCISVKYFV